MEHQSLPSPPMTNSHDFMSGQYERRTSGEAGVGIGANSFPTRPLSPASSIVSRHAADGSEAYKPSRDNCDSRPLHHHHQGDRGSRLPSGMSQQMVARQAVTPFLREHIPGTYAPVGKPDLPVIVSNKDPNSKFCYRHRPDSKCRRAADQTKMNSIQSELESLPQADQQAITHVWSLFSASPSKHRELMLQGIMKQCCFPQLSLMAREVSEQLKIDFISALPTELSYKILSFLDCASLCRAAQVNRRWHVLADDNIVWYNMCQQHIDRKCKSCGWALPKMEKFQLKAWRKEHQVAMQNNHSRIGHVHQLPLAAGADHPSPASTSAASPNKRGLSEVADSERVKRQCVAAHDNASTSASQEVSLRKYRPWKDVYRDRHKVGSNWKYGRCSVQLFRGEHDNGVTCLQFDDNVLITGSYDGTIKIWDIETGRVVRTLRGHTSGIRALQFDDRKLVSGSLDHTVKIWKWRTGECLSTHAHADGVITVHMDGEWLASGSMDKSIRLYNFATKASFCLRGHDDFVNQVKLDLVSNTLLSASDDTTVKMWDLESRSCIKTYKGHVGQVQQVMALPDDFEFEDETTTHDVPDNASVASNRSGSPGPAGSPPPPSDLDEERALYGSAFELAPARQLPPRYMLTGSLDATMRLWDTATGECLRTFFGHVEGIWGLVGDALRYVSGANDATVKIWDPKTGRCERTFTGHEGPVTCVGLSDSRMASGGEDGEVRLYRFDTDPAVAEERGTPC